MEELEDVLLLSNTLERGNLGVTESGVGALDELLEVLARNLLGGDEERVELKGQLGEGEVLPVVLPVFGQSGKMSGNVESSIGSESGQDGLRRQRKGVSSILKRRIKAGTVL